MMNMVPLEDVSSGTNFLQPAHDDFLAPLEILKGGSLCSYELNSKVFIKNRIVEVENQQENDNKLALGDTEDVNEDTKI